MPRAKKNARQPDNGDNEEYNHEFVDKSNAIRRGAVVAKQFKINVFPKNKKNEYFKDKKHTEKYINSIIEARKPVEKRGKRIQHQVVLRYYNQTIERKIEMKTGFSSNKFAMARLNAMDITGFDESKNDTFEWSDTRDTKALDGKFYINYRYVDNDGAKSEDNNCLRNALVEKFKWDESKIQLYQTIVPDGECAEVAKLPDIEYYLKVNINVADCYASQMANPLNDTINLTLFDNHYEEELGMPKHFEVGKLKEFKNRRIVLHKINEDGSWIVGQMTKTGFIMNTTSKQEEIDELRRLHRVEVIWLCAISKKPTEKVWNEYNEFEQYCRREFGSSFTRYESIANFAVELWRTYLKKDVIGVSINEDHMIDLIMRSGGALVSFVPGTYEDAKCYDFISFYPSLLLGNIPATCPMWGSPSNFYVKQCDAEQKEKYGLDFFVDLKQGWYHIEIDDAELAKETPRRFMKSRTGYYYWLEIQQMQTKRYKFKLTDRRAIVFEECERAQLFREYYTKLFEFKKETNNSVCKKAINTLLGKLATKNFKRRRITQRTVIDKTHEIVDADDKVYYTKDYRMSKYRHMPWIQAIVLAQGRLAMNQLIDEVGRENVVVVLTDSITVKLGTKEPTNMGIEMGQLKLEKEGTIVVERGSKEWVEEEK